MERPLLRGDVRYDGKAIAAREAGILGKPQRIKSPTPADVSQDAWDLLNTLRAGIGLLPAIELPGYSLAMASQPDLVKGHLEMAAVLFNGRIPPRERELAVLRIGWLLRAPYEWGEHVDIGQRYGVTQAEIERVIDGSAAPGWTPHEAAILRAVEEMLTDQTVSDETWAVLAKTWDEGQLIEFPMMVGQRACTAILQNTLRIRLESDNPGLTYR